MSPNAGGGGSCGVSANEYCCTQAHQTAARKRTDGTNNNKLFISVSNCCWGLRYFIVQRQEVCLVVKAVLSRHNCQQLLCLLKIEKILCETARDFKWWDIFLRDLTTLRNCRMRRSGSSGGIKQKFFSVQQQILTFSRSCSRRSKMLRFL